MANKIYIGRRIKFGDTPIVVNPNPNPNPGTINIGAPVNTPTFEWLGVIGSTSDDIARDPVRSFSEFRGIYVGQYGGFIAGGYNEDRAIVKWFPDAANRNKQKGVLSCMAGVVDYLCGDGTYLYVALDGNGYCNYQSGIVRINMSTRKQAPFSSGQFWNTTRGEFNGVAGLDLQGGSYANLWSGIAVEENNTLLAASRKNLSRVEFFNKTTGARVGNISNITKPQQMVFDKDGALWIITNLQVKKYVNQGSRSAVNFTEVLTLGQTVSPHSLSVDRVTGNVLVADAGTAQDVKEYTLTGVRQGNLPFLTGGNDVNNPDYGPFRLQFRCRGGLATQAGPGGPYDKPMGDIYVDHTNTRWIVDPGNFRITHYSPTWQYKGLTEFMPDLFKPTVDLANPNRAFIDYHEYYIPDWAKPFTYGDVTMQSNPFWVHKKNWSAGISVKRFLPMHHVMTVTVNGVTKTLALMDDAEFRDRNLGWEYRIVELPANGPLRITAKTVESGPSNTRHNHFATDPKTGRVGFRYVTYFTNNQGGIQIQIFFRAITGWDGNGDPIIGALEKKVDAQVQEPGRNDGPIPFGGWNQQAMSPATKDGTYVTFRPQHSPVGTKHLGFFKEGNTRPFATNLTAKLLREPQHNFYPAEGSDTEPYGFNGFGGHHGVCVQAAGNVVACQYDGQNGKAANQLMFYKSDGTFILQGGRPSIYTADMITEDLAPLGYANNIGYATMFKAGDSYYWINSDEACFGAFHVSRLRLPPGFVPA